LGKTYYIYAVLPRILKMQTPPESSYKPLWWQAGVIYLVYLRSVYGQTILVALNFKGNEARFTHSQGNWQVLFSSTGNTARHDAPLASHEVRLLVNEQ
jgi:hypothetical protein